MGISTSIYSNLFSNVYQSPFGDGTLTPQMPSSICAWFDATDAESYSGSGQNWLSIVDVPADGTTKAANTLTFGATTGASTDDPTFVGTAGSKDAYMLLDGGDGFRLDATTAAGSVLLKSQRTDASGFWIAFVGYVPEYTAATFSLFGNHSSGTQVGTSLVINTDKSGRFVARGTTATTTIMHAIPRLVPVMVILSARGDQTTDNVHLWVNRHDKAKFSATFPTSTADSTRSYWFGGANAAQFMPNGSQIKAIAYGNEFLSDAKANEVMAAMAYKHGFDYRTQTPILASEGDSNTFYAFYNKKGTANDSAYNQEGHTSQGLVGTNNRAIYPVGNNTAVVGDTTTQILTRFDSGMQKIYGNTLILLAGGNDVIQKFDPTTTQSNLGAIIDKAVYSYGMDVILCTQMPRSAWGSLNAPEIEQARLDIVSNVTWARAQAGTRGGKVLVADLYAAMEDGTNTATPADVRYTVDGVHRSQWGGYVAGQPVKDKLIELHGLGTVPSFSTGNLLTNGTLTGTGGSKAGGASGDVPDSFTLTLSGGTGGSPTLVASKPSSTISQLALNCGTGASDTVNVVMSQTISSGFAVGDTVYAAAIVEVTSPTPVNIFENSLSLLRTGTGIGASELTDAKGKGPYSNTANTHYIPECYIPVGEYIVQTPDMYIAAGTGMSLEWQYRIQGNTPTGLAASATVQIKGAGVFKR